MAPSLDRSRSRLRASICALRAARSRVTVSIWPRYVIISSRMRRISSDCPFVEASDADSFELYLLSRWRRCESNCASSCNRLIVD